MGEITPASRDAGVVRLEDFYKPGSNIVEQAELGFKKLDRIK